MEKSFDIMKDFKHPGSWRLISDGREEKAGLVGSVLQAIQTHVCGSAKNVLGLADGGRKGSPTFAGRSLKDTGSVLLQGSPSRGVLWVPELDVLGDPGLWSLGGARIVTASLCGYLCH